MKKIILLSLITLCPLITFSNQTPNSYIGLINVYSTDSCDESTAIAIIPVGSSVDCDKIHSLSNSPNRAWAIKAAGASDCIDLSDTTVKNVCEAYNK